ncbi:MAG: hypothetical protein AAGI53_06155 [Planctomycetota bacterium]
MTLSDRTSTTPDDFAGIAVDTLRAAQSAMTELLTGAGLGGAKAVEVGRELGLDKTLAWKVARFVDDEDPARAAKHLPGQGGVEIVLKAAAVRGVSSMRIEAARDADRRLRAFVREHAGDRRTFEAMLAGRERDEKLELEERRAYYRAGSAIWGVRARAQFLMLALRPSQTDQDMLDGLQVGGLIDLERLRPDVPWIVRRLRASTDAGKTMFKVRREPIDPQGQTEGGMPLLSEFCTRPLPPIRQTEASNGWVYDELAPGDVGRGGAVRIVTGEIYRSALPSVRSEDNTYGRYMLTVRTPVEHVQLDVLVHKGLSHFGPAEASVSGLLEDRPSSGGGAASLVAPNPAQRLGSPPALRTVRLEGYEEMVRRSFSAARWGTPDAYTGYRCAVEYPAAPCELSLRCELRER